ncbi:hypothetical protein Hdeb2414_s0012g00377251 [Helianthus debilis subsp. tardiflorus]
MPIGFLIWVFFFFVGFWVRTLVVGNQNKNKKKNYERSDVRLCRAKLKGWLALYRRPPIWDPVTPLRLKNHHRNGWRLRTVVGRRKVFSVKMLMMCTRIMLNRRL